MGNIKLKYIKNIISEIYSSYPKENFKTFESAKLLVKDILENANKETINKIAGGLVSKYNSQYYSPKVQRKKRRKKKKRKRRHKKRRRKMKKHLRR